jgi:integrase
MSIKTKLTADVVATLTTLPLQGNAQAAKTDHIYWDAALTGFGLRLRRLGDGRVQRTWLIQYRVGGGRTRRQYIGKPGSADVIGAKQARDEAKRLLGAVALGGDPQGDRGQRRARDEQRFDKLVPLYLDARQSSNKPLRPNSLRDIARYLTKASYFGALHNMPVGTIKRADVSACIVKIGRNHGNVTGARAHAAISTFATWLRRMGLIEDNFTIDVFKPQNNAPRERVLTDAELAAVWNAAGDDHFGRIVKLLILTGARRTEIGGMRWSELDRDAGTWTLPAERAKNHRQHALALPESAWSIIDAVPHVVGRDFLFGTYGNRGFTMWAEGKAALDKRLGDSVAFWTLHDLRRTAATKMADMGVQPHIIETVLNHVSGHKGGVGGIYNRSSYEREVKAALGMWAAHMRSMIEGGERKVIPMQAAAG